MANGYLSRDREHLAKQQRQRRAGMMRVDYMPNRDAVAILQAKRGQIRPNTTAATNSAILDAIVTEWARMTGINYGQESKPTTSARRPEYSDATTRARITSVGPEFCQPSKARVICGARRRRDGEPCQGLSVPGKRRCRWHGGASTGPRSDEGRARSMANLRQYAGRAEVAGSPTGTGVERSANIAGS